MVYQDHEDEKNSSEFFEANSLKSKIFTISSPACPYGQSPPRALGKIFSKHFNRAVSFIHFVTVASNPLTNPMTRIMTGTISRRPNHIRRIKTHLTANGLNAVM